MGPELWRGFRSILSHKIDVVIPIALRKAKMEFNFGLSECNRAMQASMLLSVMFSVMLPDAFQDGNNGVIELCCIQECWERINPRGIHVTWKLRNGEQAFFLCSSIRRE